jgi:hypothetical protein
MASAITFFINEIRSLDVCIETGIVDKISFIPVKYVNDVKYMKYIDSYMTFTSSYHMNKKNNGLRKLQQRASDEIFLLTKDQVSELLQTCQELRKKLVNATEIFASVDSLAVEANAIEALIKLFNPNIKELRKPTPEFISEFRLLVLDRIEAVEDFERNLKNRSKKTKKNFGLADDDVALILNYNGEKFNKHNIKEVLAKYGFTFTEKLYGRCTHFKHEHNRVPYGEKESTRRKRITRINKIKSWLSEEGKRLADLDIEKLEDLLAQD